MDRILRGFNNTYLLVYSGDVEIQKVHLVHIEVFDRLALEGVNLLPTQPMK